MTNYRRGRDAEYKYRDILLKKGYMVVRSAASKSPVDILAVNHEETLLVQVKRSKGHVYKSQAKKEIEEFEALNVHKNCRLLIVGWSDKMKCFLTIYERKPKK